MPTSLHGLLGEKSYVTQPARPDCPHLPYQYGRLGTPWPLCPEADQPRFFLQTVSFFLPSPHCTEHPFDNSFGVPSLP